MRKSFYIFLLTAIFLCNHAVASQIRQSSEFSAELLAGAWKQEGSTIRDFSFLYQKYDIYFVYDLEFEGNDFILKIGEKRINIKAYGNFSVLVDSAMLYYLNSTYVGRSGIWLLVNIDGSDRIIELLDFNIENLSELKTDGIFPYVIDIHKLAKKRHGQFINFVSPQIAHNGKVSFTEGVNEKRAGHQFIKCDDNLLEEKVCKVKDMTDLKRLIKKRGL